MEPGTLFIWLLLTIAPAIALGLLWCGGTRAVREAHRRKRIVGLTLAALTVWVVATYFMGFMAFVTAWGVAHTRPLPDGFFPEGWPVYGYLAVYSLVGATLIWALCVVPPNQGMRR